MFLDDIFRQARIDLDRIAKEQGLSDEVVKRAHADLDKQLMPDLFFESVKSAPKTEEEYGARLQAWREKIGDAEPASLPEKSNGRFDKLSVEDVRFLAALEIDILTEAPPDQREWKPRAKEI